MKPWRLYLAALLIAVAAGPHQAAVVAPQSRPTPDGVRDFNRTYSGATATPGAVDAAELLGLTASAQHSRILISRRSDRSEPFPLRVVCRAGSEETLGLADRLAPPTALPIEVSREDLIPRWARRSQAGEASPAFSLVAAAATPSPSHASAAALPGDRESSWESRLLQATRARNIKQSGDITEPPCAYLWSSLMAVSLVLARWRQSRPAPPPSHRHRHQRT